MLMAWSLLISEKKAVTNTELYWKQSQMWMENTNVIQEKFGICVLKVFLYLIATCGYISFLHVDVCLQGNGEWNVRNEIN